MAVALNTNRRNLTLTAPDRALGTSSYVPIGSPLSIQVQVVGALAFGFGWGRDMWGSANWGATTKQQAAIVLTANRRDTSLRTETRP